MSVTGVRQAGVRTEPPVDVSPVPPLENGDRLTRAEFERRYNAMPRVKKAELIEGEVHMPTPVSSIHAQSHGSIMTWLGVYCATTFGVKLYDNATLRLDIDNEVQPDALLRLEPAAGGHSHISVDNYVEGAPELVVEIASSSTAIDMHRKLNVYRRNEVQEYLVWQVYDRRVDWFELRAGVYEPLAPDEAGVLHSRVFPGLRLAVEALLAGDMAEVLSGLQRGIGTPEHKAFVEHLAKEARGIVRPEQQVE